MNDEFSIAKFTVARIKSLLGNDPANLSPTNRAMLAQLRQASSAEPGTAPAVWATTFEGLPEFHSKAKQERVEYALHVALTQFATHQQSRSKAMHKYGQPFGRAIRFLALRINSSDPTASPVYQRFTAMTRATNMQGLLAHSRGIISQLRSAEIPFDYGRYAQDLYFFQIPSKTSDVHRRWGRDFHQYIESEISAEGEK